MHFLRQHQVYVRVFDNVDLSPAIIAGLNGNSAASPDSLQPHMLKACTDALAFPLYLLLVRSLNEGVLPAL